MKYPEALLNLIESFSKLPSVGKKTAERYALYVFMHMDEADIIDFRNALISVKKDIHTCPNCGNICEEGLCSICSDSNRNHREILVVENVKDLFTIEKMNGYNGIYHVLNGSINFSKGISMASQTNSFWMNHTPESLTFLFGGKLYTRNKAGAMQHVMEATSSLPDEQ